MKTGRARIFRYCLCVHQLNVNISPTFIGKARAPIPNSDFLISWGSQVFTDINWAVNAMHKLGHCLGLNHGGDQVNAADTFNNKPNYLSIMNYNFSVNGLQRNGITRIVDYSRQALPSLNPTSLNEPAGLGPLAALQGTVHWSASRGTRIPVVDASQPINWNDDTDSAGNQDTNDTGITYDVTGNNNYAVLNRYNDWANIKSRGGFLRTLGGPGSATTPSNMGIEEKPLEEILAGRLPDDLVLPITTASVVPPSNGVGWNNTNVLVSLTATDDISSVVFNINIANQIDQYCY